MDKASVQATQRSRSRHWGLNRAPLQWSRMIQVSFNVVLGCLNCSIHVSSVCNTTTSVTSMIIDDFSHGYQCGSIIVKELFFLHFKFYTIMWLFLANRFQFHSSSCSPSKANIYVYRFFLFLALLKLFTFKDFIHHSNATRSSTNNRTK